MYIYVTVLVFIRDFFRLSHAKRKKQKFSRIILPPFNVLLFTICWSNFYDHTRLYIYIYIARIAFVSFLQAFITGYIDKKNKFCTHYMYVFLVKRKVFWLITCRTLRPFKRSRIFRSKEHMEGAFPCLDQSLVSRWFFSDTNEQLTFPSGSFLNRKSNRVRSLPVIS